MFYLHSSHIRIRMKLAFVPFFFFLSLFVNLSCSRSQSCKHTMFNYFVLPIRHPVLCVENTYDHFSVMVHNYFLVFYIRETPFLYPSEQENWYPPLFSIFLTDLIQFLAACYCRSTITQMSIPAYIHKICFRWICYIWLFGSMS